MWTTGDGAAGGHEVGVLRRLTGGPIQVNPGGRDEVAAGRWEQFGWPGGKESMLAEIQA